MKHNGEKTIKAFEEPIILFTPRALTMMALIVKQAPQEVGWFGAVKKLGPMSYMVHDIYLREQKVNAVECDIDKDDIAKLAMELIEQPDGVEKVNQIRMWGHSHANMGVTPSGTDDHTFEDYYKSVDDFFIMLIMNKSNDIRCELALHTTKLIYKNCEWSIYCEGYDDIKTQITKQVETMIKPIQYDVKKTPIWTNGYPDNWTIGGNYRHNATATNHHTSNPHHPAPKKAPRGELQFPKSIIDKVFSAADLNKWISRTKIRFDMLDELAQYIINWPIDTDLELDIDNVLALDAMVDEVLSRSAMERKCWLDKELWRADIAASWMFHDELAQEIKDEIEERMQLQGQTQTQTQEEWDFGGFA